MRLYHGTSPDTARQIARDGFEPDCTSSNQYWGCGVYFQKTEEGARLYGASVIAWDVPSAIMAKKCSIDHRDHPPKMHGQIHRAKEQYLPATRAFQEKMLQRECALVEACRAKNWDCEHVVYDPAIIDRTALILK